MLNGFESQWPLFNNDLKLVLILKYFYMFRVSYFDLNQNKYTIFQEFDIGLDLIAVFSLKKSPTCSLELSPIENI